MNEQFYSISSYSYGYVNNTSSGFVLYSIFEVIFFSFQQIQSGNNYIQDFILRIQHRVRDMAT